ncbi:MAG: hypothetical protein ABI026_09555 [Gemmatimonadaceae bacterium]
MSDDERLRELYQGSMTSPDRGGGRRASDCSSPEDLALLASGKGDEARRLAVLDHVMTCASCQRELDLVRAADRAGRDLGARPVETNISRHRWVYNYGTLLAAAIVFIAIGLTIGTIRSRFASVVAPGEATVLRGSGAGGAADAIRLISPVADAQLRLPLTLVWHVPDGERGQGISYRVEVLDSAGAPVLVQDKLRDTTLALSNQLLHPGENYSWWVSTSAGGEAIRSRPSRFRVVR